MGSTETEGDGMRDELPVTMVMLVVVAVWATLDGRETSKNIDFVGLMLRKGMADE